MSAHPHLSIQGFAHIEAVDLAFGDLTVLVGEQGTGKSLALQWLKAAVDGKHVVTALKDAGHRVDSPSLLIDLIFGAGMAPAWTTATKVTFNGAAVSPGTLARRGAAKEQMLFIPAHRAMLISDGWASPFQKLPPDVPVVARMFSQTLFDRFSARDGNQLFPLDRLLKSEYRSLINGAIFHGGRVVLDEEHHAKRLRLAHGELSLPFMTWTAGQREFTPLLLGLYDVLVPRKQRKREDIDWVVIEEPEMGLHPHAITVFMLLVLELLWRGYRVVLSTHSPQVLTAVWALQRLKQNNARAALVCDAFGAPRSRAIKDVATVALEKNYAVHALAIGANEKVTSKDISSLDPDAEDVDLAGWGGVTSFSTQLGDAVRTAANEQAE